MKQLNHPYWLFGFLVFSISLQAFEFSGTFPTKDYPYTIHKSGEEVCTDCPSVVAWLDNDRVIFTRLKKREPFLQMKKYVDGIYSGETVIWDTKKDKIIPYHDGKLWCSYQGYSSITYNIGEKSQENAYSFYGLEGKETNQHAWQKGDPISKHREMHTCVIYNTPPFKPNTPDWTYPLREQDGVIDTGRVKSRYPLSEIDKERIKQGGMPVAVIRPDGTRINLPLTNYDVHGVWWDEWAGVYILNMLLDGGHERVKGADKLLMLHPDGTLERYTFPTNYWLTRTTHMAAITKKGIIAINEQANYIPARKGLSGMYLLRGEQFVRLNDWFVGNERSGLDNLTRGIAVSPDGCKIAYKHTNGLREDTVSTIEMINLCEGEE